MTRARFAPGNVDEDAAHRLGRGGEEVGAILPISIFGTAEAEPGLVNESGRLKGVVRRFGRHLVRGQFAQFVVKEGQQIAG